MKVVLNNGLEAEVDDEDADLLGFNWRATKSGSRKTHYAITDIKQGDEWVPVLMHRVIAERLGFGTAQLVEHRDEHGLNNRRMNLRPATRSLNGANRGLPANNTSGYKGVSYRPDRDKWFAKIEVNKQQKYLGSFSTAEDAARAYNEAALKHFGEYAQLNHISNDS